MSFLALVHAEATPIPTPTMTVDPDSVTPGFGGFAIIALLVVAVVLLVVDMQRRVRRTRYREEVGAELDREAAAQAAAAVRASDTDDASVDAAQGSEGTESAATPESDADGPRREPQS